VNPRRALLICSQNLLCSARNALNRSACSLFFRCIFGSRPPLCHKNHSLHSARKASKARFLPCSRCHSPSPTHEDCCKEGDGSRRTVVAATQSSWGLRHEVYSFPSFCRLASPMRLIAWIWRHQLSTPYFRGQPLVPNRSQPTLSLSTSPSSAPLYTPNLGFLTHFIRPVRDISPGHS
jgi:hypothetical protein